MKISFQIGQIMGIPIKLHITFLLILPVFALIFASNPAPYGFKNVVDLSTRYILSFATTILLFSSILLHEIGHSYFAKKYGVKIDSITLMLFGGVASMEEIPRNPAQEAKMAIAGPMVSFTIGTMCLVFDGVISGLQPSFSDGNIFHVIWLLGYINLGVGVFNLLPAFPMDGGRILRAWYATSMPYVEATQRAAYIGKMFAFMMGILGILSNAWLILIAFFIYIGASEEARTTAVNVILEKVPVQKVMSSDIVSVQPSMTIDEFSKLMFEKKHMGYPVIEGNNLKGIVTFTDVHTIPQQERANMLVSDVMTKDVITVPIDADASEALKLISTRNIGRVLVTDNNSIVGILSKTDLVRALQLLSE
ncbi:MAG TPA: CBS domain-containing protein [Methanosarcinaceae archaeon]|nr:CBS domain-containing protein [Methanosarcinaceae archaeon]